VINEAKIVKIHEDKDEFEKIDIRGNTMAFIDSVVDQAWARSGERCECTHTGHGHSGRCGHELLRERRGAEPSYWWEAHKKVAGGDDTLSNCEILCQDCSMQKRTQTRLLEYIDNC
jgi:hypothetical protein